MFRIARQVLKHKNDTNPIGSTIATVNCSRDELISNLLVKLKRLANSENIGYRLIGTDKRVRYIISEVQGIELNDAITKLNGLIEHNISVYNQNIKALNTSIKRGNAKQRGKDTTVELKQEVSLKEYLSPFSTDSVFTMVDKVIIVEDDE